jgi:hypothetical protein
VSTVTPAEEVSLVSTDKWSIRGSLSGAHSLDSQFDCVHELVDNMALVESPLVKQDRADPNSSSLLDWDIECIWASDTFGLNCSMKEQSAGSSLIGSSGRTAHADVKWDRCAAATFNKLLALLIELVNRFATLDPFESSLKQFATINEMCRDCAAFEADDGAGGFEFRGEVLVEQVLELLLLLVLSPDKVPERVAVELLRCCCVVALGLDCNGSNTAGLSVNCSIGTNLNGFIQGCCKICCREMRRFSSFSRQHRIRWRHSLLNSDRNWGCSLQIWSSRSNGMSPLTMSHKRMPSDQTVIGSAR